MTATTNNYLVLPFETDRIKFKVGISTNTTGDEFEDIWSDIWSYLYNVHEAEIDIQDGLDKIFANYPGYSYMLVLTVHEPNLKV